MEKRLKAILDDYYGDQRTDDHKEEIIDFLTVNGDLVLPLLKEEFEGTSD